MTDTPPEGPITEIEVAATLERLKELRIQIAEVHEALAPEELNLETAAQEYADYIAPFRREVSRIRAQIVDLQDRSIQVEVPVKRSENVPQDEIDRDDAGESAGGGSTTIIDSRSIDPEAIAKEELKMHLFDMLDDPMANPADLELLGQVEGLCSDPRTRLSDALAVLEWGPIWKRKGPEETLVDQYDRLQTWERALADQLADLNRKLERLRKDPRYGLWQQREKGSAAWPNFLETAASPFQSDIAELREQLEALRRHAQEMVKNQ
jgi:DNA repair exonuclease SbcCD ATPase subunit